MKLGKDEISRLFLGGLLVIGVIYCYFALLLGPLQSKQETAEKTIKELEPKLAAATSVMLKYNAAKLNKEAVDTSLSRINVMIPSGSPVAWFPPRVTEFFKTHSVDKASIRLVSEVPDKALPDYQRMSWNVDFPKIDFIPFVIALAEFENEEPLVEIINVVIEGNRDNVETQRAVLTLNNLVKK
ncbi:MAG: hypothetical protein JWL59_1634 [Chthoniobacteraceae bacterium]|nr:hypothetical protein [Chthoniobacteraceae bacterium]